MTTYVYPTNAELTTIERTLVPELTRQSPIFEHFPIESVNAPVVMWEQKGKIQGLQIMRGLNGRPGKLQVQPDNRFIMEPGYYGEEIDIDEMELTLRRPLGEWTGPVNIDDLVRDKQDTLLQREIWRIEAILWDLAINGRISVLGQRGQVLYNAAYQVQTAVVDTAWSDAANALPLVDLRNIALLGRGTSHNFGAGARVYVNQTTANLLLANTNPDDIGGRHVFGVATVLNLTTINQILSGEGLPQIVVYDRGYIDDNGDFQLYIPDGVAVVMASRPGGRRIGAYKMTFSANTMSAEPGGWSYVLDSADNGRPVPREITVGKGHTGGPAIEYADAIVVLDLTP